MRKLILISVIILIGCMLNISCSDNYRHDKSLTGSISYGYFPEIEGTFDGVSFGNYIDSECIIKKKSSTKVSFYWYAKYDEIYLAVTIPELPILGKPYDVTFDYVSTDATVRYNDTEYNSVNASIKGWMKEETGEWALTRASNADPAYPSYDCDITINCTIDGKELNLRITKLKG